MIRGFPEARPSISLISTFKAEVKTLEWMHSDHEPGPFGPLLSYETGKVESQSTGATTTTKAD